jgi:hypothetical protein
MRGNQTYIAQLTGIAVAVTGYGSRKKSVLPYGDTETVQDCYLMVTINDRCRVTIEECLHYFLERELHLLEKSK